MINSMQQAEETKKQQQIEQAQAEVQKQEDLQLKLDKVLITYL